MNKLTNTAAEHVEIVFSLRVSWQMPYNEQVANDERDAIILMS